ncbi:MAG: pantoate--beta-alanine ligase [Bacteroidota bacterium]|nr:pantoate--beta-alanine ligase [Bacteroidota bacterium]
MIILKNSADLIHQIKKTTFSNPSIGFVPTMGALHQGHLSLLKTCNEKCDITVSSIFVNPTQFNNANDFKKYPVTIEQDIYLLEKNDCDILFLPDVDEIYPDGTDLKIHFNLGYLETIFEGKYRPGHFQGVCQVVKRLLEIVEPTNLFLGQKDYQQCLVIKRLLELMKVNIDLIICPTLREENGLAMSSRNLRLNEQQKKQASEIYKALVYINQNIQCGNLRDLKKNALQHLQQKGFKIDYVEIAESDNLNIADVWNGHTKLVALIAAFINDVRLIDNLLISH